MKRSTLTFAIAVFALSSGEVLAQDKAAAPATRTEQTEENAQKEAEALKTRIEQYTIKIEANRDNESIDYEAEKARIAEMKKKWESLSGKIWGEEEK